MIIYSSGTRGIWQPALDFPAFSSTNARHARSAGNTSAVFSPVLHFLLPVAPTSMTSLQVNKCSQKHTSQRRWTRFCIDLLNNHKMRHEMMKTPTFRPSLLTCLWKPLTNTHVSFISKSNMAGAQFEYDEKGTTFYYFLISFFGIVLVPLTYYVWKITKLPGKLRNFCNWRTRQL